MKFFKSFKEDIKNIQIPKFKERNQTFVSVIIFGAIFAIYLFGCDAFISYLFKLLNI